MTQDRARPQITLSLRPETIQNLNMLSKMTDLSVSRVADHILAKAFQSKQENRQ